MDPRFPTSDLYLHKSTTDDSVDPLKSDFKRLVLCMVVPRCGDGVGWGVGLGCTGAPDRSATSCVRSSCISRIALCCEYSIISKRPASITTTAVMTHERIVTMILMISVILPSDKLKKGVLIVIPICFCFEQIVFIIQFKRYPVYDFLSPGHRVDQLPRAT